MEQKGILQIFMHATPVYINQNYNQFDEYQENAIRWDLDFKKLDKGSFNSYLSMLDFGSVQISTTYVQSSMKQGGLTPKGFRTFAFAADKFQQFGWLNRTIDSNFLLCFPKDNTIDGYSKVGFHVYTVSIKDEWLDTHVKTLGLKNAEKRLMQSEFAIKTAFNKLQYLRSLFLALIERASRNPISINSATFSHTILKKLPELLINIIDGGHLSNFNVKQKKSDIVLTDAMEYMRLNRNTKTSIRKLCRDLNIRERTLEFAFRHRMGITPVQFSKAIKMQSIRNELLRSNNVLFISHVAEKYGFTHMGQFSRDYKILFDELPSETIKRGEQTKLF